MTPPVQPSNAGLNAAVADEIRAEMARQKISRPTLAERSGVAYGSLRRYLDAQRHIDVAVLEALAEVLGRSASEIVEDASSRVPKDELGDELAERRSALDEYQDQKAARTPPRRGSLSEEQPE